MISGSLMLLCATGQQTPLTTSEKEIVQEIRSLLEKWPKDFNAKRASHVCGLFAPDLIARYPRAPDRDYDAMCTHLKEIMHDPEKTYRYETPQIEEILISGDLAVVRLIWTLRITDANTTKKEVLKEIGLDVFKRQKDGKWKVSISYAYEKT